MSIYYSFAFGIMFIIHSFSFHFVAHGNCIFKTIWRPEFFFAELDFRYVGTGKGGKKRKFIKPKKKRPFGKTKKFIHLNKKSEKKNSLTNFDWVDFSKFERPSRSCTAWPVLIGSNLHRSAPVFFPAMSSVGKISRCKEIEK